MQSGDFFPIFSTSKGKLFIDYIDFADVKVETSHEIKGVGLLDAIATVKCPGEEGVTYKFYARKTVVRFTHNLDKTIETIGAWVKDRLVRGSNITVIKFMGNQPIFMNRDDKIFKTLNGLFH